MMYGVEPTEPCPNCGEIPTFGSMAMPGITIRTRVESICLQLWMLLEFIVFSSLVSNKDVWQRSQKGFQSSQAIGKKLRESKRLHPNFYPSPVDLNGSTPGEEPAPRIEGFLSENELIEIYGRLGNILHAEKSARRPTTGSSLTRPPAGSPRSRTSWNATRCTRLDEIKNLHLEARAGPVIDRRGPD